MIRKTVLAVCVTTLMTGCHSIPQDDQRSQLQDMPWYGKIPIFGIPFRGHHEQAIATSGESTQSAVKRAEEYCRTRRFTEAVKVLKSYDVYRPSNAEALVVLGKAYMGLEKMGEARVTTEKALKIKPDSAEAHYSMCQILSAIKPPDLGAAKQHYQRALDLGWSTNPKSDGRESIQTVPSSANQANDIPAGLKKLKDLKDSGSITDSEYESQRKVLVEKL